MNAHYNLMRVYRAMGDRAKAAFHEAAYRRYKDDETARAVAADYRRRQLLGQPGVAPDPRPRRGAASARGRPVLGRLDRAEGVPDRHGIPDARRILRSSARRRDAAD